MKAEISKFLIENAKQISWVNNELFCWMPYFWLDEFVRLIGVSAFDTDDGGINCKLQADQVCFGLRDILEHFDIDPEEIIQKDN